MPRQLALVLLLTLLAGGTTVADGPPLRVVATFTVVADFTREVGGDRVVVRSLVGPDGDAHAFEPGPEDAAAIAAADVVVRNGLGFEGWMDRLLDATGFDGQLITASAGITPRGANDHDHGHDHGHQHGDHDPHAWLDVRHAKAYVRTIRDGLIEADPAGAGTYRERAARYLASLERLDEDIRATLGDVPEDARVMTSHAAFGYFAAAYGIAFTAPRGLSTEAEPSARVVAEQARALRRGEVQALLGESLTDDRLLERIGDEADTALSGTLYSDALSGPDGPAPDYVAMMRHNARVLAEALSAD